VPEIAGMPLLLQTEEGQEYPLNSAALAALQARNPVASRRTRPERNAQGHPHGNLARRAGVRPLDFTVSPLTPFAQMYQAVFRLRDPFPENGEVPGPIPGDLPS
jgi:hypothetical protein